MTIFRQSRDPVLFLAQNPDDRMLGFKCHRMKTTFN